MRLIFAAYAAALAPQGELATLEVSVAPSGSLTLAAPAAAVERQGGSKSELRRSSTHDSGALVAGAPLVPATMREDTWDEGLPRRLAADSRSSTHDSGALVEVDALVPATPSSLVETRQAPAPAATQIMVKENEAVAPESPDSVINASEVKWAEDFESTNPLQEGTYWQYIGPPLVVLMVVATVTMLNALALGSTSDDVQEEEISLPESMYGESFSSLLIAMHKWKRDGVKFPLLCELMSSLVLLGVTYGCVLIMLQVAQNTIASVDADVLERDSLFEKFREPSIWKNQNWTAFPDTLWRRDSMVWFCHDIIYGKAKHVNELGPLWNQFSWVILVVWFSYMLMELRDTMQLWAVTWETRTVPMDQMIEEDEEEGDIKVQGLSGAFKFFATMMIVLPKFFLNAIVTYIGAIFLMFNDLDDNLQEILLKTIEMAFILEMDELIYEAFASQHKKQQLEKIQLPIVRVKGFWRVVSTYGELPRLVCVICIATVLALYMHNAAREAEVLTAKQTGVIEGCCNFMQYLKGAGTLVPLADGNPCTNFRDGYESAMGVVLPPTAAPIIRENATVEEEDAVAAAGEVVAGAMFQLMGQAAQKAHHKHLEHLFAFH